MTTARLNMPFVLPSQAQKHVTVNSALTMIDATVQLNAISNTVTSPPATPTNGETYIVPTGATGDWLNQDDAIAIFDDTAWVFMQPLDGWTCYLQNTDQLYRYLSGWAPVPHPETLDELGINGKADAYNRFLVQSEGVVFTNVGAHQRTTFNKNSPADDAALSFQTNFIPRALTGLLGSDDYSIKVTSDGTNYFNGASFESTSGAVALGEVPDHSASVTIRDSSAPSLGLMTESQDDVTLGFYDAADAANQNCEMVWSAANNDLSVRTNNTPAVQIAANGTVSLPQTPILSYSRDQELVWGTSLTEKVSFQHQRILQGNISINGALDEITIAETGMYLATLRLTVRNGTTGSSDHIKFDLRQNGSNIIPAQSNIFCPNQTSTASTKTAYGITLPIIAAAGDTFEAWVISINSPITLTGASIDLVKIA